MIPSPHQPEGVRGTVSHLGLRDWRCQKPPKEVLDLRNEIIECASLSGWREDTLEFSDKLNQLYKNHGAIVWPDRYRDHLLSSDKSGGPPADLFWSNSKDQETLKLTTALLSTDGLTASRIKNLLRSLVIARAGRKRKPDTARRANGDASITVPSYASSISRATSDMKCFTMSSHVTSPELLVDTAWVGHRDPWDGQDPNSRRFENLPSYEEVKGWPDIAVEFGPRRERIIGYCACCYKSERPPQALTLEPRPFGKNSWVWTFPFEIDHDEVFAVLRQQPSTVTEVFPGQICRPLFTFLQVGGEYTKEFAIVGPSTCASVAPPRTVIEISDDSDDEGSPPLRSCTARRRIRASDRPNVEDDEVQVLTDAALIPPKPLPRAQCSIESDNRSPTGAVHQDTAQGAAGLDVSEHEVDEHINDIGRHSGADNDQGRAGYLQSPIAPPPSARGLLSEQQRSEKLLEEQVQQHKADRSQSGRTSPASDQKRKRDRGDDDGPSTSRPKLKNERKSLIVVLRIGKDAMKDTSTASGPSGRTTVEPWTEQTAQAQELPLTPQSAIFPERSSRSIIDGLESEPTRPTVKAPDFGVERFPSDSLKPPILSLQQAQNTSINLKLSADEFVPMDLEGCDCVAQLFAKVDEELSPDVPIRLKFKIKNRSREGFSIIRVNRGNNASFRKVLNEIALDPESAKEPGIDVEVVLPT